MCGIVGYIGTKEAYPILIKGLHRLEYRGYDSAGIALISDNQELNVYKTKGKVSRRSCRSSSVYLSLGRPPRDKLRQYSDVLDRKSTRLNSSH